MKASPGCSRGGTTPRRDYEEQKAANADPEVGELGLEQPFTEADVLLVDRELGISNEVPRVATVGN